MTDHLADAYLASHRLTAAIAAEEYARALYEGYRDGAQYEEKRLVNRLLAGAHPGGGGSIPGRAVVRRRQ